MSWAGPVQHEIGKNRRGGGRAASNGGTRPMGDHHGPRPILLCFSHLRWKFVYQRPQHLMSRFARDYRVLFLEDPIPTDAAEASMDMRIEEGGVEVLVPQLPHGLSGRKANAAQRRLLDAHLPQGRELTLWYYTPMSLSYSDHLRPALTVYDCMDELSAFRGAPPELIERERELLARADLVFTGGYSLYEAKQSRHQAVYPFPSSVDVPHFAQARAALPEPEDQARIPGPRLGFYGVIDERFDLDLVAEVARARADWQFVLIGPVVKIDPATLPQRDNIHYLGGKCYDELPEYLAGWDVAIMPFALNESTRFISPTKTPEFLAAGRPVVSTPIRDVVRTYGESGVVRIARSAGDFMQAVEAALADARDPDAVVAAADRALGDMSWDDTFARMKAAMSERVDVEVRRRA